MGYFKDKNGSSNGYFGSKVKKTTTDSLLPGQTQVTATPKISNLDRVFGVLGAAETAPAVMAALEGQNPLEAYGKSAVKGLTLQGTTGKPTYSDVLGKMGMGEGLSRTAIGLLLDVGLDPTTYVGGAFVKAGLKPVKAVGKFANKLPVIADATKAAQDLLVPGAKLKRLGKVGEEYWQDYLKLSRSTRGGEMNLVSNLSEQMKTLEKLGIPRTAVVAAEKGIDAIPASQRGAVKPVLDTFKQMGEEETKRGLLKSNVENYIPHILSNEGKKLVDKGRIDLIGLTKPLRDSLKAGKTRNLLGTIEEINKQSLAKHGIKLFEDDIFKIAAQRGVDSLRAIKVHDFLQETGQKFGVSNLEDVPQKMINGMKYVKSTSPSFKGVLLPSEIASHLDETYKMLSNDESINGLLKAYDRVLNVWKGSVTGWFPAFHGRNLLGGLFNNFLGGVNNPIRYQQTLGVVTGKAGNLALNGKQYSYDALRTLMKDLGVMGSPGMMDVMQNPDELIRGTKGLQKLGVLPRNTMQFIENNLRGSLFIDRLAKKDTPWEAAQKVFRFHFDYGKEGSTVFENQVMKRLFPFYVWTRQNIPLQLSQIVEQPGKYGAVGKVLRSLRGDTTAQEKEYPYLPEYMQQGTPIRTGQSGKGQPNYVYGLGLPMEDVNRITSKTALDMLSPVLKYPLEKLTGKNFFYNQDISEMYNAPQIYSNLPEPIKKWLDYRETPRNGKIYRTADPNKMHFISSIVSRGLFTADKLSDPTFPPILKLLYSLTGVKSKTVDIEQQKYFQQKEAQDLQNQTLERQGKLRKFVNYYEPKAK